MNGNILYLGMAEDIMAPLLINPDVSTIFVIDEFDFAYSSNGTWEAQKDGVRRFLLNGSDEDSHSRLTFTKDPNDLPIHLKWIGPRDFDDKSIHYLKSKSVITGDDDDGKVWRLSFEYDGRPVQLVYYHHRNFLKEWPSEIKDIGQVLVMGAFYWGGFVKPDDPKYGSETIICMLETRTMKPFKFYALAFNHKHFPEKIVIKCGLERKGTEIAMITIDSTDDSKWIELLYDPRYLAGAGLSKFL